MQKPSAPKRKQRAASLYLGISCKVLLPHFVGVLQFWGWMKLGQEPSLVLGSSMALHASVHLLWECDAWSSCVHLGRYKYWAKSLILLIPKVLKSPGIICWWVMERVWLSGFIYSRRWFSLGDAWVLKGSQKPVWLQVLLLAIMSGLGFLPRWDLVLLLEQRNNFAYGEGVGRSGLQPLNEENKGTK